MLAPRSREVRVVSGTGIDLWSALTTPRTAADIAAELAARYGADLDVVAGDVVAALLEWESEGIVARVTS